LFGNQLFDVVLGLKEGVKAKADPNGVFSIAKQLDIENKQILYIADTNTDMMTAQNANVTRL